MVSHQQTNTPRQCACQCSIPTTPVTVRQSRTKFIWWETYPSHSHHMAEIGELGTEMRKEREEKERETHWGPTIPFKYISSVPERSQIKPYISKVCTTSGYHQVDKWCFWHLGLPGMLQIHSTARPGHKQFNSFQHLSLCSLSSTSLDV